MRTYEKHQLKQDKFVETTKETISWAFENRSRVVWASIAGVAVLLMALGGSWLWSYRTQQANLALGEAMQTYNAPVRSADMPAEPGVVTYASSQERARAAYAQFQKVAGQYGLTKPGQISKYMAAVSSLDMGDTKAGEAELKNVATSASKEISSLAKLALAGLYRDSKRDKDALQLYKELIANPTASVAKSTAQLELAALYENTNQAGEAGKLYSEIMKDDPRSAAAAIANQHLAALK